MNLAKQIGRTGPIQRKRSEPLWKGPEVDGITQSLLSRYLACKERFRLLAIEGLRPRDEFSARLHYGEMWHVCEEVHATKGDWEQALRTFVSTLMVRYRTQQAQVGKWYSVCRTQFPLYIKYWKKHPDVQQRQHHFSEKVFAVPYELPNGRKVLLRGKLDSVDRIMGEFWLQENKTKGDINEQKLQRQLKFDLQTMMYLVALRELLEHSAWKGKPIGGVRYNVIRRPLAGGKFSIKPKKEKHYKNKPSVPAERDEDFMERLSDIIKDNGDYFFMRWKVPINQRDIEIFQDEFLDPCLMELCFWYDHITRDWGRTATSGFNDYHYRMPYGLYNPMLEGTESDLDEYLDTGSEVGLVRVDKLFGELE